MSKLKFLYSNLNKKVFWITLCVSIVLIVVSFLIPPKGKIDPSVIAATGELIAFATLATVIDAIDKGRKATFSRGETNLTIDTDPEPTFPKETDF